MIDQVVEALAASAQKKVADRAPNRTGYEYPDTDNQMEEGVFSFAKRDDEARVWTDLVDTARGALPATAKLALDAGCGLGAHARPLLDRFADTVLIDADEGRARAAAAATGLSFGQRVFALAIAELDPALLGDRFAFVQCVQVLGHMSAVDAASAVERLRALLVPGGFLLLAVPFTGRPVDDYYVTARDQAAGARLGAVVPTRCTRAQFEAELLAPRPLALPVRHFSSSSLLSLVGLAGLTVEAVVPYHWFSHDTGDVFCLARRPA